MKKIATYYSLLILLVSCSEYLETSSSLCCGENELEEMTFSLDMEAKTYLSGNSVLWRDDDCLSVFDGVGNRRFITIIDESVSICGNARNTESYFVLYPYDSAATMNDGTVSSFVPVNQKAVPKSFASGCNLSAGIALKVGGRIQMKNAGALVKFSIGEVPSSINKIYLESLDGTPLCGKVDIKMENGIPIMTPSENRSSLVTLDSSSGYAEDDYYFSVIPGSHSRGIRLIFSLSDGTSRIALFPDTKELPRSKIVNLGLIDFSKITAVDLFDPTEDPISEFSSYGVDFSKLPAQGHPRLLMNERDFDGLRECVNVIQDAKDPVYAFHKALMKRIEWNYSRETNHLVHDARGSRNLLNVAHHAGSRLLGWAYAYKVGGNPKYLTKARSDLKDLCEFPDWDPSNFLCPSEFSFCVAVAYDWLYDDLPIEERTAIHKAMVKYHLKLFGDYEIPETGNINMVTCGAAVASAIALYDKEKILCASTIDRALKMNRIGVENLFSPYGVGVEGTGYWEYATTFEGIILQALKSCFDCTCDLDKVEGLSETGNWMLYVDGPTGCYNYSDASSEELTGKPGMVGMSALFDRPEYLVREKKMLDLSSYYTAYRFQMLSVIWLYKNPFTHSVGSFPSEKVWSCGGSFPLVLTRIGWNYDSTDLYCGMKSAAGTAGHSHMDGGSFVYDAFGERWCCELPTANYTTYQAAFREVDVHTFFGRKQLDYRWDILNYNNYFHNTLSFLWTDGSVEKLHVSDQISERSGSVVETFDDEDGCGGKIDISELYSDAASSVFRSSRIKGQELVITDEITSLPGHTARFEWRIVTKAAARVCDGYVELTQNGKTLYLYTEASGSAALEPAFSVEDVIRPTSWNPAIYDALSDLSAYRVVKFTSKVALDSKTAIYRTVFTPFKPE